LAETMKQTGNLIQGIQFKLASIIVEEKRRQLEQYERKLQAEETKVRACKQSIRPLLINIGAAKHGAYGN